MLRLVRLPYTSIRIRPLTTAKRLKTTSKAQKTTASATLADAEKTLKIILTTLEDAKAEEIKNISLVGKTALADYMVVASGRSQRHVDAIASHVLEALEKKGKTHIRVEGRPNCDWVLIDQGDVVLHIFRPEVRQFYNLEKMWSPERPSEH